MTRKKLVVYLRLSKIDSQTFDESDSITNQRKLLLEYIRSHSDLHVYEIIELVDDGFTGTDMERPSFQQLVELCKTGMVACIIVKDFSRLSRNFIDGGDYIHQVFPVLGVRVISVNDRYDSQKMSINHNSDLDISFVTLLNDLYSKDISKKIKASFNTKALQGVFMGSFAPYGYVKSKTIKGKLEVDAEAALIVKRIFEMTVQGYKRAEIAKILNNFDVIPPSLYIKKREQNDNILPSDVKCVWNAAIIRDILRNKVYIGAVTNEQVESIAVGSKKRRKKDRTDWIIVHNAHEAIVSNEVFQQAAESFQKRNFNKPINEKSIFSGRIRCGHCKHAMQRKALKTKSAYYICIYRSLQNRYPCSKHHLEEDVLKNVILETLKGYFKIADDMRRVLSDLKNNTVKKMDELISDIELSEKEIQKLKKGQLSTYEDYKKHKISEAVYLEIRKKTETKIQNLNEKIVQEKEEIEKLCSETNVWNQNSFLELVYRYQTVEEISWDLIKDLIEKIEFYDKDLIKIIWNFTDDFEKLMQKMNEATGVII